MQDAFHTALRIEDSSKHLFSISEELFEALDWPETMYWAALRDAPTQDPFLSQSKPIIGVRLISGDDFEGDLPKITSEGGKGLLERPLFTSEKLSRQLWELNPLACSFSAYISKGSDYDVEAIIRVPNEVETLFAQPRPEPPKPAPSRPRSQPVAEPEKPQLPPVVGTYHFPLIPEFVPSKPRYGEDATLTESGLDALRQIWDNHQQRDIEIIADQFSVPPTVIWDALRGAELIPPTFTDPTTSETVEVTVDWMIADARRNRQAWREARERLLRDNEGRNLETAIQFEDWLLEGTERPVLPGEWVNAPKAVR